MTQEWRNVAWIVALAFAGCRGDSPVAPGSLAASLAADVDQFTDWSAPVNLGPPVNTAFTEQGASISRDGLSLYFHCGDCPDNIGGADIYVSQRANVTDPWGAPQNLGPTVNTASSEMAPSLSLDGHRLFFNSNRPDGFGGQDIYVSRRLDERDDFGWRSAVNLGGGVNTTGDDVQPNPFEDDATGSNTLYFAAGPLGSGGTDIYASALLADETYGARIPVAELNSSSLDRQPAIRRDGLEMFLASNRMVTLGALDLWVSTRASTSHAWSAPVNLGSVVNSTAIDARAAISFDGTELYFQSTRGGDFDFYLMTRSKLRE